MRTMQSRTTARIVALSSTIRTERSRMMQRAAGTGSQRPFASSDRANDESSITRVKEHATAEITAGILGHDGNASGFERDARRLEIALADVDPGAAHERPEHARSASELGDRPPS